MPLAHRKIKVDPSVWVRANLPGRPRETAPPRQANATGCARDMPVPAIPIQCPWVTWVPAAVLPAGFGGDQNNTAGPALHRGGIGYVCLSAAQPTLVAGLSASGGIEQRTVQHDPPSGVIRERLLPALSAGVIVPVAGRSACSTVPLLVWSSAAFGAGSACCDWANQTRAVERVLRFFSASRSTMAWLISLWLNHHPSSHPAKMPDFKLKRICTKASPTAHSARGFCQHQGAVLQRSLAEWLRPDRVSVP